MQVAAATVRLRLSAEASRRDLALVCAVARLSEERAMADWRSWRGVGFGFGGRFWDWEREASHCCGKSVAAQACSIAGEAAVTAGLAGGLDGEWGGLWCAAEERVRMRERERER